LILCLLDQAHAELHAEFPNTALTTATRAAELIQHTPSVAGTARLGAFRDALARTAADAEAVRWLDEQLAHLAA
jgi:hypothetical protein